MASTQPLASPTSPLRALRKVTARFDTLDLHTDPVFDLNAPRSTQSEPLPAPFSADDYAPEESSEGLAPIADLVAESSSGPEVRRQSAPLQTSDLVHRQTGYLQGVSLSAILQMLHLERKTCVVEVSAHGWLGTLTLVNGELVDANAGDTSGEDAACMILNWTNPQTAILNGAEVFRHTVRRPITQLIMDAVRMVDETGRLNPASLPAFDRDRATLQSGNWQWLIDSLNLAGAVNVQIVTPDSFPSEPRGTGLLSDPAADLARGIRTWASLLGPDVTEVVATRSEHTVVLAMLDADRAEFIYAETQGPESTELVRRSLRSIQR